MKLMTLFKRRPADTPTRRYVSPRRPILIATKYILFLFRGKDIRPLAPAIN